MRFYYGICLNRICPIQIKMHYSPEFFNNIQHFVNKLWPLF